MKEEKIKKYMAVGFTKEQAEFLYDEIAFAAMGMGSIFL